MSLAIDWVGAVCRVEDGGAGDAGWGGTRGVDVDAPDSGGEEPSSASARRGARGHSRGGTMRRSVWGLHPPWSNFRSRGPRGGADNRDFLERAEHWTARAPGGTMIPRGGRGRVSRVLVAVTVASFLLLFLALPVGRGGASRRPGAASSSSSIRGPTAPGPTSSALVRGAFLASAATTLAVVWWRRRRAGASRGGKPPAARRARWDGSRWVELDTDDADPTQSKTTTTHAAAPPRGPFTSGASVQRPPGPSAYDPTAPFAPKTSADSATHDSGANGANGSHQMYQSDDAVDAFARWDAAEALRWARVEREDEERQRLREEREEEKERMFQKKERKKERRAAERAERERGRVASTKEKWAAHEARWATLEADPPGGGGDAGSAGPLRYDDVPWPPKMTAMLRAACGESIDGGEGERKSAYRRLIRRWHPDKFGARFGERVRAGGEEARVMERVNAVARALNQEFAGRA